MPSPSFAFPFPLLFLLLFLVFLPSSSSTHSFHDDGQSLLAFKKGITSDPNNSMADWSHKHLSLLYSLYLSDNALYGPIPPQLGDLFRLRWLWLHHNELEGNIPHQLSSCRNLVSLALSYNTLRGNIPGELGSLPHLQEHYLGVNYLRVVVYTQKVAHRFWSRVEEIKGNKRQVQSLEGNGRMTQNGVYT